MAERRDASGQGRRPPFCRTQGLRLTSMTNWRRMARSSTGAGTAPATPQNYYQPGRQYTPYHHKWLIDLYLSDVVKPHNASRKRFRGVTKLKRYGTLALCSVPNLKRYGTLALSSVPNLKRYGSFGLSSVPNPKRYGRKPLWYGTFRLSYGSVDQPNDGLRISVVIL